MRDTEMLETTLLLLVLVFFVSSNQRVEIPSDCRIGPRYKLTCEENIPYAVPSGIVEVFISNYRQTNFSNTAFTHSNWRNIKVLDVNINTVVEFSLAEFNFDQLNNVEVLGVHSRRLEITPGGLFKGLHSLRTLDFSKCSSLAVSNFVSALRSYPRDLEYLKLDQVGIRRFILDEYFLNMTAEKRVKKLSLSGTNIFPVGSLKLTGKEATLKYLDISNSTILPSFSYSFNDKVILLTKILRNVEIFNVSSMPFTFLSFDFTAVEKLNGKDCGSILKNNRKESALYGIFSNVKVFEMNDLFKYNIILNNSVVNLTCVKQVNLKSISMRKNNLYWANITLFLPSNLVIKELDMSSNKVHYLSPNVMAAFAHLQILNVSSNNLGFMERYEEFSSLLAAQRNLTDLNMAFNNLKSLPENMFVNNHKLRTLDLHGNMLERVSFKFQHLHHLETLNLSFNYIVSFDKNTIQLFDNFLYLIARTRNKTTDIDLIGNPFKCTCKTAGFIEWLLRKLTMKSNQSHRCIYEGDYVIVDENIIKKSHFLCYRTVVIVISVVLLVTIAILVSFVFVIAHFKSKAKKKRISRDKFIEMFMANETNKEHIAFVAYASDDMDPLGKSFCQSLDNSLQETFRTDRRLVSTGDLDIAPGYPIMDEVLKCVCGACVLIVIASRKFCESEWCQIELREAYKLNIPIILMFKEDVAQHLMSPIMLSVFNKFARAKLTAKGDTFQTVPEWKMFIETVINLASDYNYILQ